MQTNALRSIRSMSIMAVLALVLPFAGSVEAQTSAGNLAKTAEVTVSSEQKGFPKANAIDGDCTTEWGGEEKYPWIKLEWKEPVRVGRIVFRDRVHSVGKAQGGKLLFSDGVTLDVDDIPHGGAPREVRIEPKTVTSLRFDLFSAIGANPGLAEIEVYADGGAPPKSAKVAHPAPGTLVTIPAKDPRIKTIDDVGKGKWCAAMWCPLAGTSLKLIGDTGPDGGIADVYIDGIWQKTVDWYSEKPASNAVLFAAEKLADGRHWLGVLAREKKRPESSGTAIRWTRIEYVAGAHPERFVSVQRTRFDPNVPLWLDDRGEPMQNHLGGIMYYDGNYYMVGQDWYGKRLPGFQFDWAKNTGMPIYSSPDLMNWTYRSTFMTPSNNPNDVNYNYALATGRAKLLRARGTGKFVAIFMIVDHTFMYINTIVTAVADKPEGPYVWHDFLKLDGKPLHGADTAVFTDDDGKQYFITGKHAPDWNVADCLYELSPDCLSIVKAKVLGTGGEAPAIFKHDGVYYLLHSQLSGLAPNDNFYHTATNIWGPWKAKGKIAVGEHSADTFLTQTMDVVPVAGKPGTFIWIGDSLRNNANPYTRTVWLPITLKGKGEMELHWRDSWELKGDKPNH